jgi:type II secretory ATPase GspE/PulE/Tfp pilus assembly ATPase PilB-like protein
LLPWPIMQTPVGGARPHGRAVARRTCSIPARVQAAFLDHLQQARRITAADADATRRHVSQTGLSVVESIVSLGLVPERIAYEELAAAANMPFADAKTVAPSALALKLVPSRIARQHSIVPVTVDHRTITFLTARPFDVDAESDVSFTTGRRAVAMLACRTDLQSLLERVYPTAIDVEHLLARFQTSGGVEIDAHQLTDSPSDSAVIELCNALLARAIETGASDLHLDPSADGSVVRLRVGGVLDTLLSLPPDATVFVRNRFKVIANADISVRNRPQDGAFALRVNGRRIDVRLSSVPTTSGEKIVLRIIDSRSDLQSLDALGYDAETLARLRRALNRPDGLLLVTGPTGSGKTTSLYAALAHLRTGRVNIVSVEDPVERMLPGINQIAVNARAGNTFASVLRAVLRQDPDVVMVGEVRDAEVASMLGQAAFTGHLVLSSLHTTDAASAVMRLLNLGLEPFKVAECLSGIVAQRLVRRLCPDCRAVHSDFEARRLGREHHVSRIAAAEGPGCDTCKGSGYLDRVTLVELLTPNDDIRQAIARGASAAELRAAMQAAGTPTMRDHAARLLAEGITSIGEIERVLGAEETSAVPAPEAPKKRVLVAEDDVITGTLLHMVLERAGYAVIDARTGRQAVQLAQQQAPHLILMDLNMPEMDGYEALRQLRAAPQLSHVPIVVVTSEEGEDVQQRVLDSGADDYIVKPFEPAMLTARLQGVFSRRRFAAA